MTGVSCSSELCGRMALLFECSFSKFCRKPLLLRPSRMTVLLEARLTRVLKERKRLISSINMPFKPGDVSICAPTYRGARRVQWQKKKKSFLPLWLQHENLSAAQQLHTIIKMTPFCPNTGCCNWSLGVCSAYFKGKNTNWEWGQPQTYPIG